YILYYLYYCFFFFQAEDGIRDRNVTGVQTCALPIYGHYLGARKAFKGKLAIVNLDAHFDLRNERPSSGTMFYQILSSDEQVDYRSEERRVGKECRSRWWRDEGSESRDTQMQI